MKDKIGEVWKNLYSMQIWYNLEAMNSSLFSKYNIAKEAWYNAQ